MDASSTTKPGNGQHRDAAAHAHPEGHGMQVSLTMRAQRVNDGLEAFKHWGEPGGRNPNGVQSVV